MDPKTQMSMPHMSLAKSSSFLLHQGNWSIRLYKTSTPTESMLALNHVIKNHSTPINSHAISVANRPELWIQILNKKVVAGTGIIRITCNVNDWINCLID
ncbi:unnamed protein product [Vicia faba]|uniref:Uncharacterized protein n=1 Tax=Vicia faba TaxID=3906 RepID=A0AAV0YM79_VICFA|nr:unnamed protein product [Vicia faba]CAI8606352.1 unnamed protein product [Vicia faba]